MGTENILIHCIHIVSQVIYINSNHRKFSLSILMQQYHFKTIFFGYCLIDVTVGDVHLGPTLIQSSIILLSVFGV